MESYDFSAILTYQLWFASMCQGVEDLVQSIQALILMLVAQGKKVEV